ncbi:MAG: DUF115 domain-containing protein [Candidatus Methanoplasma sp.]|jgi:uncharacterized Rossmann fold enzyme|nr:DUF115 domain-containing protein [Candidatus Methanoplasma sp.]
MRFSEWEPVYEAILADMGYDGDCDERSARVAKAALQRLDLADDDILRDVIGAEATVLGNAARLAGDLSSMGAVGAVLCSGSAAGAAMAAGCMPDAVVTDLDGDIGPQIEASAAGAVTLIHAHGDNAELILRHAPEFRGPVILTVQSKPSGIACNYGGFTDGDRAVCVARHFGARRIRLLGFDFSEPSPKGGSDPAEKMRKLEWARRIIFGGGGLDIEAPEGVRPPEGFAWPGV